MPGGAKSSRVRAGLFWTLLDPARRATVARDLSTAELIALNQASADFRTLPAQQQAQTVQKLRQILRSEHSGLWVLLTLLLAAATGSLYMYHSAVVSMPGTTRITLFTPLLLATFAPLSLYFLPPYRLAEFFGLRLSLPQFAWVFAGTLALVWTLAFIGMTEQALTLKLTGLDFWILVVGAALAPVLEEVLFRELLPGLLGRPPHYTGHLASASLFMALHLPSGLTMAWLYFVAALFLALIRTQSGSLSYAILAHSVANVAVLVLGL